MSGFQRRVEIGDGDTPRRNLGGACAEARSLLSAFFDWCGFNDCRKRTAWAAWVTRAVLAGGEPRAVVEQVKAKWYAHRRAVGLPARSEQSSTNLGLAMLRGVMDVLDAGLPPAGAATVFRAIERDHPGESAPRLTAAHCERISAWGEPEAGAEPARVEQATWAW